MSTRPKLVTERALTEHNHRIAQINHQLAAIEKDMAAINKYCTASDDEFEKACQRYGQEYRELFERALGLALAGKQAKAALQRKS